jgi:hypothetical protein
MGLASFSAILEFAIAEEKKSSEFIASLMTNSGAPASEILDKIQSDSDKNRKNLQMILQENVTEMVMEPCEPIDENSYSIIGTLSNNDAAVAAMLEKQASFFKCASASINLKEVKRAFDKMAERKLSLHCEIKK